MVVQNAKMASGLLRVASIHVHKTRHINLIEFLNIHMVFAVAAAIRMHCHGLAWKVA